MYVESNLLHVHFGIYVRVNWSCEDVYNIYIYIPELMLQFASFSTWRMIIGFYQLDNESRFSIQLSEQIHCNQLELLCSLPLQSIPLQVLFVSDVYMADL